MLLVVGFVLLAVLMFPTLLNASAASSSTTKLYLEYDNANQVISGSVSSQLTLNTTSLDSFSNIGSTSPTPTWTWFLDPLLAGQIIVAGTPQLNIYLSASATGSWKMNTTLAWANSAGTNLGTIASITNSAFSLSTTQTLNTVSLGSISPTTIGTSDILKLSLNLLNTTDNAGTVNIGMTAPGGFSYFALPLSSPAVTQNSLTLSSFSIEGSATSTATLSVSDAFGIYDIALHTLTATIPGMSITPINAQSMTASSSNNPTAYTGTWTYSISPSSTNYGSYGGLWNIQSTVTDQSGNTYSSSVQQLNYATGGSCISCTSTSSSQSGNTRGIMTWTILGFPMIYVIPAVIVIIAAAALVIIRRQ